MKSLISIIIPTLNEQNFLEKTFRSIKKQTYPKFEIIVVDGRSSDKTVSIAKKYTDKVIVKRTNIPQAKNLGAKYANGEILVFLDADTILSRNYLQSVVNHFQSRKLAMVVAKFLPLEKNVKANFTCWMWTEILPTIAKLIKQPGFGGPATFAVDKQIFEAVGSFNEKLNVFEDWQFCTAISRVGQILYDRNLKVFTSMRDYEQSGYLRSYIYWAKLYREFLTDRLNF